MIQNSTIPSTPPALAPLSQRVLPPLSQADGLQQNITPLSQQVQPPLTQADGQNQNVTPLSQQVQPPLFQVDGKLPQNMISLSQRIPPNYIIPKPPLSQQVQPPLNQTDGQPQNITPLSQQVQQKYFIPNPNPNKTSLAQQMQLPKIKWCGRRRGKKPLSQQAPHVFPPPLNQTSEVLIPPQDLIQTKTLPVEPTGVASDIRPIPPPLMTTLAIRTTCTMTERKTLESEIFRLRQGKDLGRFIHENVPWTAAPLFATAPTTYEKTQGLLRRFMQFHASLKNNTPWDEAIRQFAWEVMKRASPKTAADYMRKIAKALSQKGEKDVRTRDYHLTLKALTRFGVYIRPKQALPITTNAVYEALLGLLSAGKEASAAMLATAWVTRCRIPDLRFMTSEDFCELEPNLGGHPTSVDVGVFAKEKQCTKWCPPVLMPAGKITAIAVVFWRKQPVQQCAFGGESRTYARIKRDIRKFLPAETWLHSTKRGAAQTVDEDLHPEGTLQAALRHQDKQTTLLYLNALNARKRKEQRTTFAALQPPLTPVCQEGTTRTTS